MPTLTIFTPAFNRAHTIERTYHSLCNQSCKDFVWLIVDDGSTDQTADLVRKWQLVDNGFDIRYVYKENGGMHTAHNMAYSLIDTELNMCIDSDDCAAEGAVEHIISIWKQFGGEKYAGIVGLDADMNGKLIGTAFPDGNTESTLSGFYNSGGTGDKKQVYRTDIMKALPPYPVFEGEKYFSLGYKYLLCDQEYPLLVTNRVLVNVDYQPDGSSATMFRQYIKNPKGFAYLRLFHMQYPQPFKRRIMTYIHYCSSSVLARNKRYIKEVPNKSLAVLCTPLGVLFALIIYLKEK